VAIGFLTILGKKVSDAKLSAREDVGRVKDEPRGCICINTIRYKALYARSLSFPAEEQLQ
jgi:hypothetical protein